MSRKKAAPDESILREVDNVARIVNTFLDEQIGYAEKAVAVAKYAVSVSDEQKFKGDLDHWMKIVQALRLSRGKAGKFARRYVRNAQNVDGQRMGRSGQ